MKRLIWIVLTALILRLGFIAYWQQSGRAGHEASDTHSYYSIAKSLADGAGYKLDGELTVRRPPVYPLFLVPFIKTGLYPLGALCANAVLGALSCFLLFSLAKSLFGAKSGYLASLLLCLDYVSIRQTVTVLPEVLYSFLILAFFYLLFTANKAGAGKLLYMICGLISGLVLLTKDAFLPYFPVLFLYQAWQYGKKTALLLVAGLLLVMLPWILRNKGLLGEPVVSTATFGHTFYIANNPKATGGTGGEDWAWGRDSFLPEEADLPPLMTPQADRYLLKRSLRYIYEQPASFLRLAGRKIINMWRPWQSSSPLPMKFISGTQYLAIMIFASAGFIFSRWRWREFVPVYGVLLYVFILHSVFVSCLRYRYPIMPLFMMFAAFGFLKLIKRADG